MGLVIVLCIFFRFIYLWMNIIYCWNGTEFREYALFQFLVFIEVNTEKCFSYKQETGMEIWLQLSNSRSDMFELPCCV